MSIDDLFAEVARRAPAFGGLFFDEQENLTMYLLDSTQKATAEAAIVAVLGSHRPDLSKLAHRGVQVLQGQYSFSQLREWKDRIRALLTLPGVAMADIDEGKNRLTVGVETLAVTPQVEVELAQLGIPREAVNIVQAPVGQLAAKLTDTYRPIIGGLQFQYNRTIPGPTPPSKTCTLGFNANRSGVAGFLINSHCTDIYGGVESTLIGQKDLSSTSNRIGVETVDPTFFTGDPCPAGQQCRFSWGAFSGPTFGFSAFAWIESELDVLTTCASTFGC